ncbi:hypothetical protein [Methanosarcina sp.]|nr:hypothetical protein [Methanosarcina sp.]MDW5550991.1 hypothetical protein [Methanosarcina sp.]MDW5555375.1 hypothetical protein [Methanosarcina sp.]MDW5561053.1 hypothetical protein [Methanosarcina sp.]
MNIISKEVEILLVEDNEGDVDLVEEVFEEIKLKKIFMFQKTEKRQSYF